MHNTLPPTLFLTQLYNVFEKTPITPSLVKATLQKCSVKSAPGWDNITYNHPNQLPAAHHFLAT